MSVKIEIHILTQKYDENHGLISLNNIIYKLISIGRNPILQHDF